MTQNQNQTRNVNQPVLTQTQQNGLQVIASREKQLQAEAQRLKQQEAALARRMEEFERKLQEAAGKTPDPTQELSRTVQALQARIEELSTREQQYQQQALWQEARGKVRSYLEANAEKYPFLKTVGAYDDVADFQKTMYERTGELLSEDEVASQVNDYFATVAEKLGVKTPPGVEPPQAPSTPVAKTPTLTPEELASAALPTEEEAPSGLSNAMGAEVSSRQSSEPDPTDLAALDKQVAALAAQLGE
jgi:hypothetical protein